MSNDRIDTQINLLLDKIVNLYHQGKFADMVLVIDNLIHHAPDNKKRSELFDKIIIATDLVNNPNKNQKQTVIDILKEVAADLMTDQNGKKLIQDKVMNLSKKHQSSTSQIDKMMGSAPIPKIKKINDKIIVNTPPVTPTAQSSADVEVPSPTPRSSRKKFR